MSGTYHGTAIEFRDGLISNFIRTPHGVFAD